LGGGGGGGAAGGPKEEADGDVLARPRRCGSESGCRRGGGFAAARVERGVSKPPPPPPPGAARGGSQGRVKRGQPAAPFNHTHRHEGGASPAPPAAQRFLRRRASRCSLFETRRRVSKHSCVRTETQLVAASHRRARQESVTTTSDRGGSKEAHSVDRNGNDPADSSGALHRVSTTLFLVAPELPLCGQDELRSVGGAWKLYSAQQPIRSGLQWGCPSSLSTNKPHRKGTGHMQFHQ